MQHKPCRQIFTETLLSLARNDRDIIAVTTDARGSVTLTGFADELPDQFIELGIAEQNALGIGAGLAASGKKVFVCGPACFYAARGVEQIKLDIAYTGNPVKIIGVSGGVSYGALGSSHHSLNDIAVMRSFPGLTVILPCDNYQTRIMTEKLVDYIHPVFVRMGRAPVPDVYESNNINFEIGRANILMDGEDIALIGTGETVYHVLEAGKALKQSGIHASVIDMHTVKPIDSDVVLKAARETGVIITVEEHSVLGGLGSSVSELVSQYQSVPVRILGFPDEWAAHGSPTELFHHYGLTKENIVKQAIKLLNEKK
ncbi:MAG: transketolase [Bacteroides sp. SM23_62_1]|nr:MAG: transketolase [Bacteroides sp. SM23_62_1]